ncbi:metal-binding protein [Halobacteriales archaeon QS_9_67_17]|nr:MAG: metal-binding protein [Halobacteriales archaeon QS_9_67_17]
MRKQELIHVHELLAAVERFCECELGVRVDAPEYESMRVRPHAIHAAKARHETAVFHLAETIDEAMTDAVATEKPAPEMAAD